MAKVTDQVQAARRIPGRLITIPFVVAVIVILALGVPIMLRFEHTQEMLEAVRDRWPPAAVNLQAKYVAIDQVMGQAENQSSDPLAIAERWRSARDRFDAQIHYDKQIPPAIDLEKLLQESEMQNLLTKSPELVSRVKELEQDATIQKYLQSEAALHASEDDWLGRLTCTLFRLSSPPPLRP